VLFAPSATTHAANMTQRVVPLKKAGAGAGALSVAAPPSGRVAPPGWYMLFVLDANGTPSVARWTSIG
jgi:hypothetical protein